MALEVYNKRYFESHLEDFLKLREFVLKNEDFDFEDYATYSVYLILDLKVKANKELCKSIKDVVRAFGGVKTIQTKPLYLLHPDIAIAFYMMRIQNQIVRSRCWVMNVVETKMAMRQIFKTDSGIDDQTYEFLAVIFRNLCVRTTYLSVAIPMIETFDFINVDEANKIITYIGTYLIRKFNAKVNGLNKKSPLTPYVKLEKAVITDGINEYVDPGKAWKPLDFLDEKSEHLQARMNDKEFKTPSGLTWKDLVELETKNVIKKFETLKSADPVLNSSASVSSDKIQLGPIKLHKCMFKNCGKSFRYASQLHMLIHLKEKNHKCDVCGYRFVQKVQLIAHLKVHTKNEKKPTAYKKLKKGNKLQLSKDTKKQRSYTCKCEGCDVRFTKKYSFLEHMKLHTGGNMYTCDICGHRTPKKGDLILHIKSHVKKAKSLQPQPKAAKRNTIVKSEGKKCTICGKLCRGDSKLVIHLRVHTNERPYSCDWPGCEKKFRQKGHLKEHLLTHKIKEKNYTCNLCDFKSSWKKCLIKHLRAHEKKAKASSLNRQAVDGNSNENSNGTLSQNFESSGKCLLPDQRSEYQSLEHEQRLTEINPDEQSKQEQHLNQELKEKNDSSPKISYSASQSQHKNINIQSVDDLSNSDSVDTLNLTSNCSKINSKSRRKSICALHTDDQTSKDSKVNEKSRCKSICALPTDDQTSEDSKVNEKSRRKSISTLFTDDLSNFDSRQENAVDLSSEDSKVSLKSHRKSTKIQDHLNSISDSAKKSTSNVQNLKDSKVKARLPCKTVKVSSTDNFSNCDSPVETEINSITHTNFNSHLASEVDATPKSSEVNKSSSVTSVVIRYTENNLNLELNIKSRPISFSAQPIENHSNPGFQPNKQTPCKSKDVQPIEGHLNFNSHSITKEVNTASKDSEPEVNVTSTRPTINAESVENNSDFDSKLKLRLRKSTKLQPVKDYSNSASLNCKLRRKTTKLKKTDVISASKVNAKLSKKTQYSRNFHEVDSTLKRLKDELSIKFLKKPVVRLNRLVNLSSDEGEKVCQIIVLNKYKKGTAVGVSRNNFYNFYWPAIITKSKQLNIKETRRSSENSLMIKLLDSDKVISVKEEDLVDYKVYLKSVDNTKSKLKGCKLKRFETAHQKIQNYVNPIPKKA